MIIISQGNKKTNSTGKIVEILSKTAIAVIECAKLLAFSYMLLLGLRTL